MSEHQGLAFSCGGEKGACYLWTLSWLCDQEAGSGESVRPYGAPRGLYGFVTECLEKLFSSSGFVLIGITVLDKENLVT